MMYWGKICSLSPFFVITVILINSTTSFNSTTTSTLTVTPSHKTTNDHTTLENNGAFTEKTEKSEISTEYNSDSSSFLFTESSPVRSLFVKNSSKYKINENNLDRVLKKSSKTIVKNDISTNIFQDVYDKKLVQNNEKLKNNFSYFKLSEETLRDNVIDVLKNRELTEIVIDKNNQSQIKNFFDEPKHVPKKRILSNNVLSKLVPNSDHPQDKMYKKQKLEIISRDHIDNISKNCQSSLEACNQTLDSLKISNNVDFSKSSNKKSFSGFDKGLGVKTYRAYQHIEQSLNSNSLDSKNIIAMDKKKNLEETEITEDIIMDNITVAIQENKIEMITATKDKLLENDSDRDLIISLDTKKSDYSDDLYYSSSNNEIVNTNKIAEYLVLLEENPVKITNDPLSLEVVTQPLNTVAPRATNLIKDSDINFDEHYHFGDHLYFHDPLSRQNIQIDPETLPNFGSIYSLSQLDSIYTNEIDSALATNVEVDSTTDALLVNDFFDNFSNIKLNKKISNNLFEKNFMKPESDIDLERVKKSPTIANNFSKITLKTGVTPPGITPTVTWPDLTMPADKDIESDKIKKEIQNDQNNIMALNVSDIKIFGLNKIDNLENMNIQSEKNIIETTQKSDPEKLSKETKEFGTIENTTFESEFKEIISNSLPCEEKDCIEDESLASENLLRDNRNSHHDQDQSCLVDGSLECTEQGYSIAREMEALKNLHREKQRMEAEIEMRLSKLEARMEIIEDPAQQIIYRELVDQITEKASDITNVHVMEIHVFDILQKRLIEVLREREQSLREIVTTVQTNVGLMREWLRIARQTLIYKEQQGTILFGEFSSVSYILHTGMATTLRLTEQFFKAVESITTVKSQFIDSFVSGGGSEDFLQRAQNFTVAELIPTKVKIILNAYNHSEEIAKAFGEIVKNANMLLETKYRVVESIITYGQDKMEEARQILGTNLTFLEFLDTVQRGSLLKNINIGPIRLKGDFLSRYETERIIKNLLSMGEPRLPVIGIPVKEMFANNEDVPRDYSSKERKSFINNWLMKRLADTVTDTFYTITVKNGEAVLETDSPTLQLGDKCGLGFRFQGAKGRTRIGRNSQVSLTAGPAFGYGRPPSLDIVTSAWLDTSLSYTSKVAVTASKGVFGKCITKFTKLVNMYVAARAKSYFSLKFSIIKLKVETRSSHDPAMYGLLVPHIVIKFRIHLAGEIYKVNVDHLKISNCNLKIMGITLFSYCGLIERLLHNEARQAAKRSLPFSSPRVLRQIERAIVKRFGDEISIPLFVLEDRPLEKFFKTTNNIIQLAESLVRNVTSFQGQMSDIMNIYY